MSLHKAILAAALLACPAVSPAQAPHRTASSDSIGPSDEMICRRFLRIGTLADYYRTCKTRGEWERERRNIRQGLSVSNSCRNSGSGIGCGN